jgi:hypothetical protein
VLFAEKDGTRSSSQIMAFEDTREWNVDAERAYEEIVERGGKSKWLWAAGRGLTSRFRVLAGEGARATPVWENSLTRPCLVKRV